MKSLIKILVLSFIISISSFNTIVFSEMAEPILNNTILPVFEVLDRSNGLSNLSVSSIIQDKYGVIWFGTQGGLNRYDGKEFTVFRNNPFDDQGLLHNLIQTLTYNEETHELWIGTYQGLSRYNIYENTFTNYTVENSLLSNPVVVAIEFDADGFAWVGTLSGLNRIDPKTHDIKTFAIPGDVVRSILYATDQKLYIGTYEGLHIYQPESETIAKAPFDLPSPLIMVVKEFEPMVLSVGMWDGGIAKVDLSAHSVTHETFEDNRVYSYIRTSDGTEWVGTWGGGLFAIDSSGQKHHFPGTGSEGDLHHKVVYSLYQSTSEILWVGTNGGGIVKINPRKRNYVTLKNHSNKPESLSAGKINLIYRDKSASLWVAVYNSGVERWNALTQETTKYTLDGDNVISVIELDDGSLIFGSTGGLSIYDSKTDSFMPYDVGLKDQFVYALALDDTNKLWIGTYREGIYSYDLNQNTLKKHTISDQLVYDILIDSKKRIWVGTNNGLNLRVKGASEFRSYFAAPADRTKIPSNTVRKIFEDSKGHIWIATVGGGLSKYIEETDTFVSYTENEGLSSNTVLGILEGNDGSIWASTLDGISVMHPKTEDIVTLSPEDGLGGYEFNSGHFKDIDGSLLFGGAHGITAMPSEFRDTAAYVPKVYITDIEIFQKPIPVPKGYFNHQELTFGPNENMLAFRFIALDYDAPEKIHFYYKLTGVDPDWIFSDTRNYISYSNLRPGEYVLSVYAVTARGLETDQISVAFIIKRPWYLTWYAFLLYLLLIYLFFRMLLKLREGKLLAEANAKLEALSISDHLTGAYNRRYFSTVIEQQLQLAKRSKSPMSILMMDIDDFKKINDSYGHYIGDQVLIAISESVKNSLHRSTDFIARFGGDEFAVGLYDTSLEGALSIAQNIKVAMDAIEIPSGKGDVVIKPTLSIGVYSWPPDSTETLDELVQKADEALYRAKRQGKNTIIF